MTEITPNILKNLETKLDNLDICAHHINNNTNQCLDNNIIIDLYNKISDDNKTNTNDIINELTEKYNCTNDNYKEICIINAIDNNIINENEKNKIKAESFKPFGTIDANSWLTNTNTDEIQEQLYKKYKNYYYSYIHMIDLVDYPTQHNELIDHPIYNIKLINFYNELNNINYPNKITVNNNLLKYYGVICNTDDSSKGGQHWFSIFMNFNSHGTISDPYTIEYFNSSGNDIRTKSFNDYFTQLAIDISLKTKKICKFIKVTNIRHQSPETGVCGVYSIYYIWCRLEGIPYQYFNQKSHPITDKKMTKFREYLYRTVE